MYLWNSDLVIYLCIGSSTNTASSCLNAKQVIENRANEVVMEESAAGRVPNHDREDWQLCFSLWTGNKELQVMLKDDLCVHYPSGYSCHLSAAKGRNSRLFCSLSTP